MLRDLFISKTRVKILEIFLSDPNQMYHVRDLVRRTEEEINAVRRELLRMDRIGMVKKEPRGNRLYYWFRTDYVYFPELVTLVAKNTGLGASLIKNRSKLGNIKLIMISGRFLRKLPRKNSDEVELLVVGDVILPELASLVRAEETRRGQAINYTPMTEDELKFRRSRRDPFLHSILTNSRVMILGDQEDLTG